MTRIQRDTTLLAATSHKNSTTLKMLGFSTGAYNTPKRADLGIITFWVSNNVRFKKYVDVDVVAGRAYHFPFGLGQYLFVRITANVPVELEITLIE